MYFSDYCEKHGIVELKSVFEKFIDQGRGDADNFLPEYLYDILFDRFLDGLLTAITNKFTTKLE